jgi:hypothetical protein
MLAKSERSGDGERNALTLQEFENLAKQRMLFLGNLHGP